MTDSNIHPPQGSAHTDVDIKDPQPIPGTEVTEAPGLVPEEIDYLAPETTRPGGFYNPETANVTAAVGDPDGGVNTTEGYVPADTTGVDDAYASAYPADMPQHPDPDQAHHELMSDPNYAVHVHESQLSRIVEVLEEICGQINGIDSRLGSLEESVRWDRDHGHNDGPPEPPTGTDYSITGNYEPTT